MPEEGPHVDIGRLRWPVTLAVRVQTPQIAPSPTTAALVGTGITETLASSDDLEVLGIPESQVGIKVYADVQAVGGLTFWGAEQTDTPITHRIFMRWHDYLDQTKVVVRETLRPNGTTRREIFRVRRIKELGGRKRFVMIEAELEKFS